MYSNRMKYKARLQHPITCKPTTLQHASNMNCWQKTCTLYRCWVKEEQHISLHSQITHVRKSLTIYLFCKQGNLYLENPSCETICKGFFLYPITVVCHNQRTDHSPFLYLQSFNFLANSLPDKNRSSPWTSNLAHKNKTKVQNIVYSKCWHSLAISWKMILLPSDMALKKN